jgi:hypothetical protein
LAFGTVPEPAVPPRPTGQVLRFNNQFDGMPPQPSGYPEAPVPSQQAIQWVSSQLAHEYLAHHQNPAFLNRLPTFQLPNLPSGNYRAFEAGDDFAFPGALLVGLFVRNWYEIRDGGCYLFVLRHQGMQYRRAYNQVKTKGVLLLSSDKPGISSSEVSIKEVLEVWEVKAFVSLTLPEPGLPVERISQLVEDLRRELDRTTSAF